MSDGPITAHERLEDGSFCLQTSRWLPRPIDEVFAFFADAANLQLITPPFVHFKILTPLPVAMGEGTLIDYQIRLHGIPVRWRTQITVWQPPTAFEDVQLRGPYQMWRHHHTFVQDNGGTLCNDRVIYRVPGGWLVQKLFVGRDVERIFRYRDAQMLSRFGPPGEGP